MILLIGLGVGVISGVVGIGGGILIIPALIYLLGMANTRRKVPHWARCCCRSGCSHSWNTIARAMRT
ncbi:MAG: hypothetical protein WAK26_16570 [Terracidiphilus sp.]